MPNTQPGPKVRRSRWPFISIVGVVGLVTVWSGLWLFASNQAGAAFDTWIQVENAKGRQWTCPDRRIDGYPFALKIRCAQPTFHGEVAGRQSSGTIQGLRARFGLDHPRSLRLDLTGPMHLRADNGDYDLTVSWTAMELSAGGLPGPPNEGTLEATRLAVTLVTPDAADMNARAAHLRAQAAPGASDGDAAFALTAADVSLPTLDGFTGSDELIQAAARGVLAHADLLSAPTMAKLEAWRGSAGHLQLDALTVAKGEFSGQASGTLALDDNHRIAGHLDTSLTGFGPLAERFGIPIAGVKLGGLLSSLLSGKKAAPASASGDSIRLPVVFKEGRLLVGPFATSVRLDPIY